MYRFCFSMVTLFALLVASGRTADKIDFRAQIRPILAQQCFDCDGADEPSRKAEQRLEVRDEAPTLPVPNPVEKARVAKLQADLAQLKSQLEAGTPAMQEEQAQWEQLVRRETPWQTLTITELTSAGKLIWEKEPDGSVLLRSGVPAKTTYDVQGTTPLRGITALRLEVLPDDALPNRGPGHALSGNAVVNEVQVSARPTKEVSPAVRFVRVEAPGKGRLLHLAEVEVMSQGQNVARQGKASQISTDYAGEATRAIDGNTNGEFAAHSTTHTAATDNPWWEVDLGKLYPVDHIVLWNRMDGDTSNRLPPFKIVALDEARHAVWQQESQVVPKPSLTMTLSDCRPTVGLRQPSATFSQQGWEVGKAVDGDVKTGWAFAPRCGEPQVAVFELGETLDFGAEAEVKLNVRLVQEFGENHTLGRFRLSVTNAPLPVVALSESMKAILAKPLDARTPAENGQVRELFRGASKEQRRLEEALIDKQKELNGIKPIGCR